MPRASYRRSRGPGLAIRVAGLAALVAGAFAAACSAPAATPLYSLVIDATPTPPAGEQARQAFIDRVVAGDLSYHATFEGLVYGAANDVAVAGSLDVAGSDYQLVAVYTFPEDPRTTFSIRYVGGAAWVRIGGASWQTDDAFRPAQTNSPFAFVTGDPNVTFVKTETVSGQRFHHVTIDRSHLIGLAQIQAGNLTNEELKRTSFSLVLDDDGAPVSGTSRIEGVARVSGQLQEIIVALDLVFSKVGADIVIKAP